MTPEQRFDMIVSRLDVLHRDGCSVRARCPAHGSVGGTLAIRTGEKRIEIKCFAGCDGREVMRAIGLSLYDLYYEDNQVNRTAPFEISNATLVSNAEVLMSLRREIFPEVEDYTGWTFNDDMDLTERLVSYCENYDYMRGIFPSRSIRLECVLIRLYTLMNAVMWQHDYLMKNYDKAGEFLSKCDKTAVRQFVQVRIMKSTSNPRVLENDTLYDYLKVCSRGIWVAERAHLLLQE